MKKIVITGGPCAGKSTVMDVLQKEFAGQLSVVPEVATMLLSGGWPVPGQDIEWSLEWQKKFQIAVSPMTAHMEEVHELKASQEGINLLVCDRGVMDGAAYTPGGVKVFCVAYGIDHQAALARYASVLHLESLALTKPELYGKANNTVRFESLEEAQALEYKTRDAWQGHPQWHLIDHRDLEDRIVAVCRLVRDLLAD